jgi:hypothetical protein
MDTHNPPAVGHDLGTPSSGAMSGPGNTHDMPLAQHTPPHQFRQHTPNIGQTPQPQHQHPSQQLPSQQLQQQLQQQHSRSVKRPRPVKSCTECRKRKLRCDRLCPCSQCQKSGRACKYAAEHDSSNLSDVSDTEAPEVPRQTKRHCLVSSSTAPPATTVTAPAPETPNMPIRNGDQNSSHLYEELTLRMERLEKQILSRSPAGTELSSSKMFAAPPSTIRGMSVKRGAMRTRFFGQNNPRILMNLVSTGRLFG